MYIFSVFCLIFLCCTQLARCSSVVEPNSRVDCAPKPGITKEQCLANGCQWDDNFDKAKIKLIGHPIIPMLYSTTVPFRFAIFHPALAMPLANVRLGRTWFWSASRAQKTLMDKTLTNCSLKPTKWAQQFMFELATNRGVFLGENY